MNDFHRRYNLHTDRLISFFTCTLVSTTPSFHQAPEKCKDGDMDIQTDVLSRRNVKIQGDTREWWQSASSVLSLPALFHSYTWHYHSHNESACDVLSAQKARIIPVVVSIGETLH